MLRMFQSKSAEAAKRYYTEALSRADYYAENRDTLGAWRGSAAERLGLDGPMTDSAFAALCDNRHPTTGARLTPRTRDDRTVGYDMNFHVPKGVSLIHAIGGDERVRAAMEASVEETMAMIEADMHTRVRLDNRDENRPTGNMVWASFTHLTARPVDGRPDPHLHRHCFVMNATFDPVEGRWKAGQFRQLKRDSPYYQAVYHAKLALKLIALGYAIQRRGDGWDIAGIARGTVERFSRRTNEIEAAARRLGITDAAMKAAVGARTRKVKETDLPPGEMLAEWRGRLTADELSAIEHLVDTAAPASLDTPGRVDIGIEAGMNGAERPAPREPMSAEAALQHAIDHVYTRKSVETARRLVAEALKAGVGSVTADEIWAALEARDDILTKQRDDLTVVTTRAVHEEELSMLRFAKDGKGSVVPLGSGYGGRAGERYEIGSVAASEAFELNTAQRAAVEHLVLSSDRVMLLRGGAGTGKTTLLKEANAAIEHGGKRVIACAVTTDASRGVLRDAGFREAETLQKLLVDRELHDKARGQVIWVDEAGMVGTPTMLRLFELAESLDARVVLAGDTKQHPPVERGDAMRLLEEQAGIVPAEVGEILRQRGLYKRSVEAITEGKLSAGIELLDQMEAIREMKGPDRHAELAERYAEAIESGKTALVVSPTHAEGEGVTARIRETLKERGRIGGEERAFTRLVPLHRTDAEKKDAHRYEVGDVVQFNTAVPGSRDFAVKPFAAGQCARVIGVDATRGLVTTEDAAGERRPLPLGQPQRFEVYREASVDLAEGDRVRITRNGRTLDGKHRLTNGAMYKIKGFTEGGHIVLDNAGAWTVSKHHGHLTHGYCTTPQAAQGKSVDVCLAAMGSGSMTASTLEQLYVIVSRGKERVELLTDKRPALVEAIQRLGERESAVELIGGDDDGHGQRAKRTEDWLERQRLRDLMTKKATIERGARQRAASRDVKRSGPDRRGRGPNIPPPELER